jgi:hypothetical protein
MAGSRGREGRRSPWRQPAGDVLSSGTGSSGQDLCAGARRRWRGRKLDGLDRRTKIGRPILRIVYMVDY